MWAMLGWLPNPLVYMRVMDGGRVGDAVLQYSMASTETMGSSCQVGSEQLATCAKSDLGMDLVGELMGLPYLAAFPAGNCES